MALFRGAGIFMHILVAAILASGTLKGISAQKQDPVTTLEGNTAKLTFKIPTTTSTIIVIRLDRHDTGTLEDVLFVNVNTWAPKLAVAYQNRLKVSSTAQERRLDVQLENVRGTDAGTFKCLQGSSTVEPMEDCGQLLIVIRKPNTPTISVLPSSSLLEGSNLLLVCEPHSTSLPPDHGLRSEIWWYDDKGDFIGLPGADNPRISVNVQNQLVLQNVQRSDDGLKFRCASADNAGDIDKRIQSDKSDVYEVIPEFQPKRSDITLTPPFNNDDLIEKRIGELIEYRCDAECRPACDVTWMYKPHNRSSFGDVMDLVNKQVLSFHMDRLREGTYRCKAENNHGIARQTFELEALYMAGPKITINGELINTTRILEDKEVNIKCAFDSNPDPIVTWLSPSQETLFTQKASGPEVNDLSSGVRERLYTSEYSLRNLKCEDSGIYSCQGKNDVNGAEGRMNVMFMCPPTASTVIPDMELQSEYVWEIPYQLSFKFLIRAFPEPDVTRVLSTVNGQNQLEQLQKDVEIAKSSRVNGKPYLTQFTFTSRRELGLGDMDRIFTMTIESSEFKRDFQFTIQPRGPPHKVENLTAEEVSHDSVSLFWLPGFNGGEVQTFTVRHRKVIKDESGEIVSQQNGEHHWTQALDSIQDVAEGNWVNVKVRSLSASTNYVIQVIAYNLLGNSTTEIELKTAVAPDESLSGGAVAGIVIAVLLILVILLLVFYFIVYPKIRGEKEEEEGGKSRKKMIPEQLTALFQRNKDKNKEGMNGTGANDKTPKEGPVVRMKNLFKRKPKREPGYKYVPKKDYDAEDDDNDDNFDDGEYVNTDMRPRPGGSDEIIYENTSPLNNNADNDTEKVAAAGKKTNPQGLVYADLEFSSDKKKGGKDKKKPKKTVSINDNKDRVDYSDIDFAKTEERRKEEEARRQKEEAERRAKEMEDAKEKEGSDDAPDGGASEDGDGDASKRNKMISNENFGTAV